MSKQTYLVAVDGSEWGERAANFAVNQAKQTGSKVIFITVIPWSGYQPLSMGDLATRPLNKKLEEDTAHSAVLNPLCQKHAKSGVDIDTELHWGDPREIIAERTKKLKARQLFVGRRGRSRLADLVLGSVANSLAHCIGVPITLVP